ncbi:MAG TPA: hypothetical protein VHD91_01155 [Gaiellaceae bacterium]|nr:hypothetical protein [Gaiellaceae bacterium]
MIRRLRSLYSSLRHPADSLKTIRRHRRRRISISAHERIDAFASSFPYDSPEVVYTALAIADAIYALTPYRLARLHLIAGNRWSSAYVIALAIALPVCFFGYNPTVRLPQDEKRQAVNIIGAAPTLAFFVLLVFVATAFFGLRPFIPYRTATIVLFIFGFLLLIAAYALSDKFKVHHLHYARDFGADLCWCAAVCAASCLVGLMASSAILSGADAVVAYLRPRELITDVAVQAHYGLCELEPVPPLYEIDSLARTFALLASFLPRVVSPDSRWDRERVMLLERRADAFRATQRKLALSGFAAVPDAKAHAIATLAAAPLGNWTALPESPHGVPRGAKPFVGRLLLTLFRIAAPASGFFAVQATQLRIEGGVADYVRGIVIGWALLQLILLVDDRAAERVGTIHGFIRAEKSG